MTYKLIKTLKDAEQLLLDSNGLPYCKNCGLEPAELIKQIKELEEKAYSKGVRDWDKLYSADEKNRKVF